MAISKDLLMVLVCPKCLGPVRSSSDGSGILCARCQVQYPVRDDVPVMVAEEAISARQAAAEEEMGRMFAGTVVCYAVEGKDKGLEVTIPQGCCRAVGRSLDDLEKTRVYDTGSTVDLDDSTKRLVLNYVTQQFQGAQAEPKEIGKKKTGDIGSFRRLPDVSLSDEATSRLHAMLFHGPNGVGVLDLVSKNGTFVNGVEVESKFLKEGDIITIGGTKLRIGKGNI